MITVGFIGAGNMGSALARAASKVEDTKIYLYDKDGEKAAALASEIGALASDLDATAACDYVFLAVKPNIIKAVAAELPSRINKSSTVVSMAAGVSIEVLEGVLGKSQSIIRIMPNTPAACGKGMMLYTANGAASSAAIDGFKRIMAESGELDEIPERLIDAGCAVSGCGPAFVYMFIEALADGGVECGLPRDKALKYACETVIGAAETVKATGIHPEALKDAVCSPGGSTIAGVHALEEGSFRATSANAVLAAYKKTLTLGK